MILIFLLTIIEAAELPPETSSWVIGILGSIITILLLVISSFLKILHSDFKALKLLVDKNKEDVAENKHCIGLNKQMDKNTLDRFEDYQKQRGEKDDSLQKTLDGINESLSGLNKTTGDLAVQVGRLEEKIK